MGKLQAELIAANEAFLAARDRAQVARRQETEALNALNTAQKAFDEGVDASRVAASAPGSKWACADSA